MLTCGCVDMENDRCRGTAVVTERCCSAASDMAPRARHDPASQAGGCRLTAAAAMPPRTRPATTTAAQPMAPSFISHEIGTDCTHTYFFLVFWVACLIFYRFFKKLVFNYFRSACIFSISEIQLVKICILFVGQTMKFFLYNLQWMCSDHQIILCFLCC